MLQLQVIGNLGADAVAKEINGKQYISMRVASTERRGQQERTTWVSVLYRMNDRLLPYLRKGAQVYATGDVNIGTYTNRDGATSADVSLWANVLQLVGGKAQTPEQAVASAILPIEQAKAANDEIPF